MLRYMTQDEIFLRFLIAMKITDKKAVVTRNGLKITKGKQTFELIKSTKKIVCSFVKVIMEDGFYKKEKEIVSLDILRSYGDIIVKDSLHNKEYLHLFSERDVLAIA